MEGEVIGNTIAKVEILTIVVEDTEEVGVDTITTTKEEIIITIEMTKIVSIHKKISKLIKNLIKVHIKILIFIKNPDHMSKNLITIITAQEVDITENINPEDLSLKSFKKLSKLKLLLKNKKLFKNLLSLPDRSESELIRRYQFLLRDANFS